MAPSAGTLRVGRYFAALLALLIVLYGIVFWPHQRSTPKLGLDLQGGAQVVLQAKTDNGKTPSKSAMTQARQILTNRVNGNGVTNAEIVQQGSDRIVISVPGKQGKDLQDVSQAALLQFRAEIQAPVAATSTATTATPSTGAKPSATAKPSTTVKPSTTAKSSSTAKPASSAAPVTSAAATAKPATSSSQSAQGEGVPLAAASSTPTPTVSATPKAAATPSSTASPSSTATPKTAASPSSAASPKSTASTAPPLKNSTPVNQWAKLGFTPPADATALAALSTTQAAAVQAVVTNWSCDQTPLDVATSPLVTCDQAGLSKYLLGPVIVAGKEVSTASAQAPDGTTGSFNWAVSLSLRSTGQAQWARYTSQHNESLAPGAVPNNVAFTLDSAVIEASDIQSTINGGTQITGGFNQSSANQLANSLKYGALPLNFTQENATNVSATLGSSQLKAGLLAGGIGLTLVVLYSLLYYRALGLVTIASLIVSAGLTYAMLVILGVHINFTLTLAGVAGFIVAIGITADSFVVFFERIKDEVHEGRSARVAVPRAWVRARRTIISADTVSLLAAVILYYFAAGDVRGFAFTLGMSTVLDLVVVYLFTHPLVSFVSRSEAFGSARFSGLNAVRAPRRVPAYAGGGQVAVNEPIPEQTPKPPVKRHEADLSPATDQPPTVEPRPPRNGGTRATANGKPAAGASAAERAAARRGMASPAKTPQAIAGDDSSSQPANSEDNS